MTSKQTSNVARTSLPVAMNANRLLSRAIAMTTTMMTATRGDARDRTAIAEICLMDFSLIPPRNARAGQHSKGVNVTWIARERQRVKGASEDPLWSQTKRQKYAHSCGWSHCTRRRLSFFASGTWSFVYPSTCHFFSSASTSCPNNKHLHFSSDSPDDMI